MDREITVELWLWRLDGAETAPEALAQHLDPAERARAARFARPGLAARYIAARGRMREILGRWTGTAPRALRFAEGAHGKPALPGGPHFNLSHSGDLAALAVCASHEVGVDIETRRPVESAVAERFFSPAERAALSALPAAAWEAGFFNAWTRKEAVIKALGLGLSLPLDCFDVTLAPGAPARLTRIDHPGTAAADWTLLPFDAAPDTPGALALRAGGRPVRLHRHP